jgi:outer membrane protein assembly factor BamB
VVSETPAGNPKKGLYIEDLQGKTPPGEHRWLLCCYDWKTGKRLWQKEAHKGKAPSTVHIKNSYASETPAADAERVYAYFGNVGVFCYTHDGEPVWSKSFEAKRTRFGWGPAASPALHKDTLFVVNDNEDESSLLALDAKTGKQRWSVSRDEKSNWATPFVWQSDQRTEVVTAGTGKVRSYGLDGKLLWELGPMSSIAIPTPFTANGLLYVTSGYVLDPRRPLYAVKPGAAGELKPGPNKTLPEGLAWVQPQGGPYHPTPLAHDGRVYVLFDRGFLSCFDAKTGKAVYEKARLTGASAFTASPWASGDKLFCLSEDGDTHVVRAGPEFKVLGVNRLDEMTLSTPALARGSMLLRTMNHLYRIDKGTDRK